MVGAVCVDVERLLIFFSELFHVFLDDRTICFGERWVDVEDSSHLFKSVQDVFVVEWCVLTWWFTVLMVEVGCHIIDYF